MPYLRMVLRDALGETGHNVRLGNIRCISSKRGWWTRALKEEIWERGGGGWMVGKVNVGKSQLFESVFPKGRFQEPRQLSQGDNRDVSNTNIEVNDVAKHQDDQIPEENAFDEDLSESSLLPPPRPETAYPTMPIISALPGTTASPIRIPFGNGKGELIDLPGLARGDLENYVQEEHRKTLVMQSRIQPKQQVLKPGSSLLLGGLIRITPTTPDLIFMAYSFVPIETHLTSTEKAIAIQTQQRDTGVTNIALPGVGEKMKSAGNFQLKWDVTKERSGPVTARDAGRIAVDKLPYRVLATDILIEGCGWIELVVQVRKRWLEERQMLLEKDPTGEGPQQEQEYPEVEIFTPDGRFIGNRRPMNAWLLNREIKQTKARPRRSMKGVKKAMKIAKRASTL